MKTKARLITNLKHVKRLVKTSLRYSNYVLLSLIFRNYSERFLAIELWSSFSGQLKFDQKCEAWFLDIPGLNVMTTFFDIDPISPNGKKIVVTCVPFIDRIPFKGDEAIVLTVDLDSLVITPVYKTKGWGAQLGANAQWLDDNTLVCNDVVNGDGVGVKIDLEAQKATYLEGPIYTLDTDSRVSYSPNLRHINALIHGYGIPLSYFKKTAYPKSIDGRSIGISKVNLETGEKELFLSVAQIESFLATQEPLVGGQTYVFNVKLSPDRKSLIAVVFKKNVKGRIGPTLQLIHIDIESKNIKLLLSDKLWSKGGHHPNWCNDSLSITMNLKIKGKMRFVSISVVNGNIRVLSDKILGGGHPSFDKQKKYLLTDAYVSEGLSDINGYVPIRLIDLQRNNEKHIAKAFTKNLDGPCRIDPHPSWSKNDTLIVWNAVKNGKRTVYLQERASK